MKKRFTPEEDEIIRELSATEPDRVIAERLGRTKAAVGARRRALGIIREVKRYAARDDRLIRELAASTPDHEIARRLGRPTSGVIMRRRQLGIRRSTARRPFTPEEDEIIRELGAIEPDTVIAKKLGRGRHVVGTRRRHLGIRATRPFRAFTEEEDQHLRAWAGERNSAELARDLNRDPTAVRARLETLGITAVRGKTRLTESELQFIRDNVRTMPMPDMAERLGRSQAGIFHALQRMGLEGQRLLVRPNRASGASGVPNEGRRWTEDDLDLLHSMYTRVSAEQLGEWLGRTPGAVQSKAQALGITTRGTALERSAGGRERDWTPADEEELRSLWMLNMHPERIALALGRTEAAVRAKAARLGFTREDPHRETSRAPRSHQGWTPREDRVVKTRYHAVGAAVVARELGRSQQAVYSRAVILGVARPGLWTEHDDAVLRELLAAGRTQREIADELGRTPGAVGRRAGELGVRSPRAGRPWSPAEDAELLRLGSLGLPVQEIADRLGRTGAAVRARRFTLRHGGRVKR